MVSTPRRYNGLADGRVFIRAAKPLPHREAKTCHGCPKGTKTRSSPTTTAAEAASFGFKEKISWKNQLCGFVPPTEKDQADRMAIGGLRDAATSVGKLSAVAAFGRKMYAAIRETLVADRKMNEDQGTPEKSWVNVTCKAIGSTEERVPPEAAIEAVRAIMVLYTAAVPADSRFVHLTEVDAHLLEAWRKAAGDPDDQVFQWLTKGAPAGVLDAIKDPGIFPDTSGPSAMDPDDLDCDEATFRNYAGVEENVETEAELLSHISKEHIVSFGTYKELTEYVGGGKVILNKIGLIEKTRNGKKKVRMILDTKASDVKRITGKAQRVMLPRLYDAILHLLYLMALLAGDVGAFVLDFKDAFWQVPISLKEQRFFCATALFKPARSRKRKFTRGHRNLKSGVRLRKYLAWKRAPQGSAAGPTLWGRVAALLMRLTQSLFDPDTVRMMCYVDDPLAALLGDEDERCLHAAIMVLVWSALGFKLAYAKGQLDQVVTWIGGTITAEPDGIRAVVKESIIKDILIDLNDMSKLQVIPVKSLQSLLGKLNHAAGLLIVIRPFMEPMWAALTEQAKGRSSGAPPNTIWRKQISSSLVWFTAFFKGKGTHLERFFRVDAYSRTGTEVEIGTDASPWGMGGWLTIDGVLKHWYACPVTEADVARFKMPIGDAKGQQLWECLAILIAVDVWAHIWSQQRIILKIRGDNVGALVLCIKMRPANATIAIVARELALRLAGLSFREMRYIHQAWRMS